MNTKSGMIKNIDMSVTHTYNPNIVEVKVGKSESHSHPLPRETLPQKQDLTKACVWTSFPCLCAGFSALLYD